MMCVSPRGEYKPEMVPWHCSVHHTILGSGACRGRGRLVGPGGLCPLFLNFEIKYQMFSFYPLFSQGREGGDTGPLLAEKNHQAPLYDRYHFEN